MEKPSAIICDLDGTLAVVTHRLHFVSPKNGEKKDWKSFFAGAKDDTLNNHCHEIVKKAVSDGQAIIFLTGRPAYLARDTQKWILEKTGIQTTLGENLFMRPNGNRKEDTIVKEEIYLEKINPTFNVVLALDDKESIVKMWEKHGIKTVHYTSDMV